MMNSKFILSFGALFFSTVVVLAGDGLLGWNERPVPGRIAVCPSPSSTEEGMILASLSGLAAQAVAEGRTDEMIWEDISSESYVILYKSALTALSPKSVRTADLWDILKEYAKSGIVKGYVLYKKDMSPGKPFSQRKTVDLSVNVATVYAGVLGAVLVEESLEAEARKAGLKKLKDCRQISPETCFAELRPVLNNRSVVSMDPKLPNCREYAIANRLMVYYGTGDFPEKILEWVEPLSPVVGWNCGEEFVHTAMVSRWGHFNTASDKCGNMMVLAAASAVMKPAKISRLNPGEIDYLDFSSFHSYLLSDGDNMQWTNGTFLTDMNFFANPDKGRFGMNWTSCPCNLSVMSVPAWNIIAEGLPDNNSIIEYGGGYYYPDLFACNRPDRKELLTEFAERTGDRMNELGIAVLGVICSDINSTEAAEAFEIFAAHIKGLSGIVAMQYYPYEQDAEVKWFEDAEGMDIPVVMARYSIWDAVDANRPLAGTPEFVSAMVNRSAMDKARSGQQAELSFTIVHAWSCFNGWNSSMEQPCQGASAAYESSRLLLNNVKTVSLDELIWRIRMRYRPEQTNRIVKEL